MSDMKSISGKKESTEQLWLKLFKDPDNQSNIKMILDIGLKSELFLTPQVAIIIDELIGNGKEDSISILFPYIIKPSNEVLSIVQRWFTDPNNHKTRKLAALLLVEAKYIFKSAIDTMVDSLKSDNDQMRYRAQRVFQHPERDVSEPICTSTNINDETYFEIVESKLVSELTVRVENISQSSYSEIQHVGQCNFNASNELNETILNILNNIPITIVIMQNLIKWLIHKMKSFKGFDDTMFTLMMCDCLLSLVSACVQKEDYLYRKITNSQNFDQFQFIKLLEKMVHNHPYFPARGSAFILLSAMDQTDHKVIINALNTLFDENLVKEYSVIGIPLIRLSPNEFIDDLLESLRNESAIKAYEILKILTQFALDEKIDAYSKTKIINYLVKEIGELKSKKPVNYYYTDIKIPFTTTLENELYKAWVKIQGLS
ncbi:unnamed protein product, partial [Rotaria sordida]